MTDTRHNIIVRRFEIKTDRYWEGDSILQEEVNKIHEELGKEDHFLINMTPIDSGMIGTITFMTVWEFDDSVEDDKMTEMVDELDDFMARKVAKIPKCNICWETEWHPVHFYLDRPKVEMEDGRRLRTHTYRPAITSISLPSYYDSINARRRRMGYPEL